MQWRAALVAAVAGACIAPASTSIAVVRPEGPQVRTRSAVVRGPGTLDRSFGRFKGLAVTELVDSAVASVSLNDLALTNRGAVAVGTAGFNGSGDSGMVLVHYTRRGL